MVNGSATLSAARLAIADVSQVVRLRIKLAFLNSGAHKALIDSERENARLI